MDTLFPLPTLARIEQLPTLPADRLLRPGWAAAIPALRAVTTPLQRAFDALTRQVDAIVKNAQLASQNLTQLRQVPFVKQGSSTVR